MKLIPYNQSFQTNIENYHLIDLSYTALPKEILKDSSDNFFPVLCFEKDQLVCFFILDSGKDKFNYTNDTDSLLLRAFSTDSFQTKKGFATSALKKLPAFAKRTFPSVNGIYLGVNIKNELAIHLYESVGFKDTKRTFNGPKGIQRIFTLSLQ